MARYEHLRLVRLSQQLPRRKKPGFGASVERDRGGHAGQLSAQLDEAVEVQTQRKRPGFVDPSLILRVSMTGSSLEADWVSAGFEILSSDSDRTLILFSSSGDLEHFKKQIAGYGGEIPKTQKSAPYANFVSSIERIGTLEPRDRLGTRLREDGFNDLGDFDLNAFYLLDLELWQVGNATLRRAKLEQISGLIESGAGQVLDEYIGPAISLLRIRVSGSQLLEILLLDDVSQVERPPQPDTFSSESLLLTISDLPEIQDLDDNLELIGIIDSGVNDHPLLAGALVGAIGVPQELGSEDSFGHGTRVAGIAAFGDIRAQLLMGGPLIRSARICSAKVVNARGGFDDGKLVPRQMRDAIYSLHEQFGCRIFNISLADIHSIPYAGGKVGAWTATLDELASELDILIIVSAGNRLPRQGELREEGLTGYPNYLLEDDNRFLEPSAALNVLTVGSISHGNGMDEILADSVGVRPITEVSEPSPFTRVGPGIGGAIKPDIVDLGGTMIYDPLSGMRWTDLPSTGLITLNHQPHRGPLRSGAGTSYSAPMVANKAAQLLRRLPGASANLLRALLIGSAQIPDEIHTCLRKVKQGYHQHIRGNGYISLERATYSDDSRVVLVAEDALPLDNFAVYEIPIPEPFYAQAGTRTIRITLAFNPPVRHTRVDYAGVKMNFRLVRGKDSDFIFEYFRQRTKQETAAPKLDGRFDCDLQPGPQTREKGTVQTATVTFKKGELGQYGDRYYLVIRCESGWADYLPVQNYAVAVEIAHEADVQIYQRIQQRVRTRILQ
ncbi:S8 family peptidase [Pseudomonas sp. Irchel 3A5]|uniref:S8 family peptidase n=1 Tax=Pseudomonas sp. Irchel 3A5 TaxID=2008911 RepID=UPI000BA349A1|nr:S8 family peptidase [Pseudomonas sp. Irchel 3A5]